MLRDVTIEIERGEICALLGPNGCGKSTLLKILAGILKPQGGLLKYSGQDFLALSSEDRAQRVAYVAADFRSEFPMTAQEAVLLGRLCHPGAVLGMDSREDHDRVHWAMELCHCWNLRERDLHTLSGGERQLVGLARALAQGAKVLLLDESLSRMDLNHQALISKQLRSLAQKGWSVILVSHDLNLAAQCAETCVFLKKGERVVAGSIRDMIKTETIKKIYPGAELQVGTNAITGVPHIFFGAN